MANTVKQTEDGRAVTRPDLSSSLEDYLEAIHVITRSQPVARSKDIATRLSVSRSSVTGALRQLAKEGLIEYSPYQFITLTEDGEAVAQEIACRHETLELFLRTVLRVPVDVAAESACRMEHAIGADVLEKFVELIAFVDRCPRAGSAWLKGLGEFCRHGEVQDGCRRCVEICLDAIPSPADASGREEIGDVREPRLRKRRDTQVREQFLAILDEAGRSLADEELAVIDAFLAVEGHQTVESLCAAGSERHPAVTTAVVERTIELLCEYTIAKELRLDGQTLYEHYHPESHHDHIVCVKCGARVEFFDPRIEDLQRENARGSDFRLLSHKLNMYGVCHSCIELEGRTVSLDQCPEGDLVRVLRIVAEPQFGRHIAEMGLRPGVLVRILGKQAGKAGVSVMVSQTRLMLDARSARSIKVVPEDADRRDVPTGDGSDMPWRNRNRHRHALEEARAPQSR